MLKDEKLIKVFSSKDINVRQALKKIDEAGEKILIIVDQKHKLLGVLTDGNIRRWILKGGGLEEKIENLMTKEPIFLYEGFTDENAKTIMMEKQIECIPILNRNRKVITAIWWFDFFKTKLKRYKKMESPVVIMAGGEGTRLAPFTKILPKPLIPIGDKTIIELIIDKFLEYGCSRYYLSVNHKANIIKAYLDDVDKKYFVHYIRETKPLGTVGSLHILKDKIKTTFFVTNCDILIDADYSDIYEFHKKNKYIITLINCMKHYVVPYGICEIKKGGVLKKIKEKPEYNFFVNTGMYLLEPDVLEDIPVNRFYHITDLINSYLTKGKKIGVYPVSDKSWIDIGQLEELQEGLKKLGIK